MSEENFYFSNLYYCSDFFGHHCTHILKMFFVVYFVQYVTFDQQHFLKFLSGETQDKITQK